MKKMNSFYFHLLANIIVFMIGSISQSIVLKNITISLEEDSFRFSGKLDTHPFSLSLKSENDELTRHSGTLYVTLNSKTPECAVPIDIEMIKLKHTNDFRVFYTVPISKKRIPYLREYGESESNETISSNRDGRYSYSIKDVFDMANSSGSYDKQNRLSVSTRQLSGYDEETNFDCPFYTMARQQYSKLVRVKSGLDHQYSFPWDKY